LLNKYAKYFDDFGGREQTGGFRANRNNLGKIRKGFIETAEKELSRSEIKSVLEVEAEMTFNDINWDNYDKIQLFEPFGRSNKRPVFLVRGLEIGDLRTVGNGNSHLKMDLIMFEGDKARKFSAIAFGFGDKEEFLKKGQSVDVVFELIANQWNGQRNLEMKVVDMRLSN
jgi:single-stranded-DNA-specific exonuclease